MKKVNNCVVENCIPTPTSCAEWNGGDIEYLGICNGDSLNNIILEIVTKLKELAGEDLSQFDIDSLLEICTVKAQAPTEITIVSILELVKTNQVCLKDFVNELNDRLNGILGASGVNINLKCYADFDNQGNALDITRDELDQLIINNLCNHKDRIETLEGKAINLQSQIDNLSSSSSVDELNISTCVDPTTKPTSSQVIAVADAHCELEVATGDPTDIAAALGNVPSDWNTKFSLIVGWDLSPDNLAEVISNLLLVIKNHEDRIAFMEENCCAFTCDDVKLGFSAVFNEDGDGIIIKFTSGAGTSIPAGFIDKGSTGTVTDKDGNVETFTIDIVDNFAEGNETEVLISGLNTNGELEVEITSKVGTDSITCEKCLKKTVRSGDCGFCVITATGDPDGEVVIVYEDESIASPFFTTTTTTTSTTSTSSTTTTTTAGV